MKYDLTPTDDGSYTFFSPDFGEAYHSRSGAREEAEKKFVKSCQVAKIASENQSISILDICYGLGYNTAAALAEIEKVNPRCHIKLIALELDQNVGNLALENGLLRVWGSSINDCLKRLVTGECINSPYLEAQLLLGDARQTIQVVEATRWQADVIFLDPFSPTKCPQLWSVEFLTTVARCLKSEGYLATYSCAASVRWALQLARLCIGRSESVGRRSPGTLGRHINTGLQPLSLQETEHLLTRAAIPYRDPSLKDDAETIIKRRQQEQDSSDLEITSHWRRRWR
ncbi:MAG: tRNA 5-methylaminomethyl-2-thiouridine biosynthesis bifunctional protein MnmC [Chroococcopsis gigantea SAG 12.99]|jgi:tRNA U34 5-methylaminomethyl-2-thiouridine-forming methyltransferase MnmC|nr:tRNA 5-methylaminomethyl-2-thiouridine biosynthesis bifunctional protein MnmC [Chroococcopsis gigantea SAG 12.99]